MARSFDGSAEVMDNAFMGAVSRPLTVTMWVRVTGTSDGDIFGWSDRDDGLPAFRISTIDSTKKIRVLDDNDTGADQHAESSNTYTVDQWSFVAGIWASTSSRKVYLDGTLTTDSNALSGTQTLNDAREMAVAGLPSGGANSFINYLECEIAEVAIYKTELSTDELDQASAGYSPLMVRPQSLWRYWQFLVDGTEYCLFSQAFLTARFSPPIVDHVPIVYLPSTEISYLPAAPSSGSSKSPSLLMGV